MQPCSIVFFDILGKEISRTTFNPLLRQIDVNTKDWADGLYTFKIIIPNSVLQLNGNLEIIH
jgi:hypothetical protein